MAYPLQFHPHFTANPSATHPLSPAGRISFFLSIFPPSRILSRILLQGFFQGFSSKDAFKDTLKDPPPKRRIGATAAASGSGFYPDSRISYRPPSILID